MEAAMKRPMKRPSFLKPMSPTSLFNALGVPGVYCAPSCVLIDCRPVEDYRIRHIRGAINLPPDVIECKESSSSSTISDSLPAPADTSPGNSSRIEATKGDTLVTSPTSAPPETAERIYEAMWERFCNAYIGCYMPRSLILYTSERDGESEKNRIIALSIFLRKSRRGILHDIFYLEKGFGTFAEIFPFQCRSHEILMVRNHMAIGDNSSIVLQAKKQIEQLGVTYIINCDGETKQKFPMCAYFDLKLSRPEEAAVTNFCTECGMRFRAPVKFCSRCGEKVSDKSIPQENGDKHIDFRACVDIVDRCRRDAGRAETGRNILIYCKSGNSLSAAVTIAFLMSSSDMNGPRNPPNRISEHGNSGEKPWTLKRVLKFVRKHRPTVDLTGYLLRELARYEKLLIHEARLASINVLPRRCVEQSGHKKAFKQPAPTIAPPRISTWKSDSLSPLQRHGFLRMAPKRVDTDVNGMEEDEKFEVEVKSQRVTKSISSILRKQNNSSTERMKSRDRRKALSVSFAPLDSVSDYSNRYSSESPVVSPKNSRGAPGLGKRRVHINDKRIPTDKSISTVTTNREDCREIDLHRENPLSNAVRVATPQQSIISFRR
eukprot:jgi/Bigna1/87351/estExt_fgenesh1_pg.C_190120